MVKLTVLYNLPDDVDEEKFIQWRKTIHEKENSSMEGVIKTDFYVAECGLDGPPRYRFVTEVYWDDMETLKRVFFSDKVQNDLANDKWKVTDRLFIISEEVSKTVVR
jgi:hypothetical protein